MSTLWSAVAAGVILFMGALLIILNQPTWVTNINESIALASTVLGFALAVFGAVKSGFAIAGLNGLTTADIVPSGGAAAAGAALLFAARFIGG